MERRILMRNKYNDVISGDFNFSSCRTLVISGGGFKALYFVGAVDAMELCRVDCYAGTSCGAALCALMCAGATPLSILKRIVNQRKNLGVCSDALESKLKLSITPMVRSNRVTIGASVMTLFNMLALFGVAKFIEEFEDFIFDLGHDRKITFEELHRKTGKNLAIVATDIVSKFEPYVMSTSTTPNMSISEGFSASCSLAVPVRVGHKLLMDGYYSDNFPVHVAMTMWPDRSAVCVCSSNTPFGVYARRYYEDRRCHFVILPLEPTCGEGVFAGSELMFVMYHFGYRFVANNRRKVDFRNRNDGRSNEVP
ncbi:34.5 kDa Patatin phospholipase [Spodoptera frugiperda ascovirus 1a]|uniref:34.5 kDa Patatin phospholipase n=1 Tax=Spodoptera frugiperda ascovirus 1a TaxID=113370 RepID=Q0E508_SFAVA|nr:34.5 kDa Patatin phospholipase [Spodoptera frugiperda ascovirus 1a]CAL44693.1 34.5 kDa Patatin phospholipase [Spodoptera frugiperda ascovirus 1a]